MQHRHSRRHRRVGYFGLIALAALVGGLVGPAFGGPVLTEPVTLTQPDGTTFVARPGGDEWFNWFSYEGTLIVQDEAGWWWYARDVDGALEAGIARAAIDVVPRGAATVDDVLRLAEKVERPPAIYASAGGPATRSFYHRGLVILVEFQDVSISTSDAYWSNLFFGTSGKTVRTYLDEVSGGTVQLDYVGETYGAPDGVIRVRLQPSDHNSGNHPNPGGTINDSNRWIVYDALYRADAYEAFNAFDTTPANGVITPNELHLVFVVAGYDRGYGDASTPAVIGHRWSLGFTYGEYVPPVQLDGVQLCTWVSGDPTRDSGYMQIGELHGDHAATMGEPCHEFGHDLGLPDLYDTTGASSGIGGHGLMGYGVWGTASGDADIGATPTHMCAWSKTQLGFVTPIVASANADYTLMATGSPAYNAVRMNTSDANQYFLIENRQLTGFDAGLYHWFNPTSGGADGGGLAIWHIDESIANNNNPSHKHVDLEEANEASIGHSELDALDNQGNRHHYFYAGHVGDFGDATTPNSRLYSGNSTDINVSSVSVAGETMKCYIAVSKRARLAWSTYLGGSGADYAYDLALDSSENVYVAGYMNVGGMNRTIVKLDANGGFVNAVGIDVTAEAIDVDEGGNAYITGYAPSWFMARPSPTYGDSPPYVYDYSHNGGTSDVYVAKIDSSFHNPGFGQSWATFLGGNYYTDGIYTWSGEDGGQGIAVNNSGEPVVAGRTDSRNFPVVPSGSSTYGHSKDGFVAKFNSTGTGLLYSRYLAEETIDYPSGTWDEAFDVAYDSGGNAWVTGRTNSDDFDPCEDWTYGFQPTFGGFQDAFMVKVSSTGSILAASYLGGVDLDAGYAVVVDSLGYPYGVGFTHSTNTSFPLVDEFDSYNFWQTGDAYITVPYPNGQSLAYSTFYGGYGADYGYAIDVDSQYNMYLAGYTESDDLQISDGAIYSTRAGGRDAYVARINADGTTLDFGTYLGGSANDEARGIAVGSSGAMYVAGFTVSDSFPTTSGAYDEDHNGGYDAFVAKISLGQVTDSLVVGIPDGGETWCVDQSGTIRWSSSGAGSYVKIELSRDGTDGPWETLYTSTDNDGTEDWTVTGAESTDCYVRVTDTADGTLADVGNAAFTIMTCSPPTTDPPTPPTGEPGYRKIRYISFVPANPGMQTALRVTLTDLPAPFNAFDGLQMWVGQAVTKCENAGQATPPGGGCGAAPGLPLSFRTAYMQCTPYCMDYGAVGALHVTDDEIVPNAVYDVQAIDCGADFGVEANYSDPLTIRTSKWSDLVGNCAVIPCTPPDGIVNITTDVTAVLDKFKNLPGAVMKSRADMEPNKVEWLVNITDVTKCLDAFLGQTYPPPGWTGPGGCPPTGPRVETYGNSGCLGGRLLGRRTTAEPCSEDDSIELTPGPGTLDVIHRNATYNCCQDDIRVSSTVQASLLRLTEEEVPPGGYCDCICCFNVEATVVDLAPGEYTVEYCWLDDEQGLRCHTADIVIP